MAAPKGYGLGLSRVNPNLTLTLTLPPPRCIVCRRRLLRAIAELGAAAGVGTLSAAGRRQPRRKGGGACAAVAGRAGYPAQRSHGGALATGTICVCIGVYGYII